MAHEYENEIICPYCDYKFQDSWEYGYDTAHTLKITCPECNRPFEVMIEIDVKYTSNRINCEVLGNEHHWKTAHSLRISQKRCDDWNAIGFAGKKDWVPHTTWLRDCKNCEEVLSINTELDAPNPFDLTR